MLTGHLLINKPKQLTSFQCIKHIKYILKQKIKIGHTGTLDPFATGLIIICIGREATKSINSIMDLNKEYVVTAKLGESTDSLDFTGKIISNTNYTHIKKENLTNTINEFGSEYQQTPPIYSALKYKGQPLYSLARNNNVSDEKLESIIKEKARTVLINKMELLNFNSPYFTIKTNVSKGTYIRCLVNDIAKKLNTYATTYKLERTKIGNIPISKAISLNSIKTIEDIKHNMLTKKQFDNLL